MIDKKKQLHKDLATKKSQFKEKYNMTYDDVRYGSVKHSEVNNQELDQEIAQCNI